MGEEEAGREERDRRLAEAAAIGEALREAERAAGAGADQVSRASGLQPEMDTAIRAIMELMREGAALLDEQGRVIYCNGRLAEMLRRSQGDLVSQSFGSFVHSDDAETWAAAFGDGDRQTALGCTLQVVAAGQAIAVHIAVCSLGDPLGRLAFVVASDLAWQEERMRQLEKINKELERQREALEVAATTDSITGAYSSGAVYEVLQPELAYGRRYGNPVSVLLMDLDDFKMINDTYGHAFGDIVLREFCDRCREAIRTTDYLVRYGGDEFVVILPQTDSAGARAVGKRILASVRGARFGDDPEPIPVTVSVGASTAVAVEDVTGNELLKRADQALYEVKRHGRDGLAFWNGKAQTRHGRL
ncbi:MAG: sensor domain-containing diguanylate cyclase [Planctomycetota bacterium]